MRIEIIDFKGVVRFKGWFSFQAAIDQCVSADNASSSARSQIAAGIELLLSSVRQINDLFAPDEEGKLGEKALGTVEM